MIPKLQYQPKVESIETDSWHCSTASYLNYNGIIIQILFWLISLTELLNSPDHKLMFSGHGKTKVRLRAARMFSWDDICMHCRMWFFL